MGAWRHRRAGRLALAIGALASTLAGVVAASGDARTLSLYHIHTKETLTVLYKKDGRYLPDAMKKINWFLRDWRRNESTQMDPKTIDIIWEMHTELGSMQPVHIISGYRSRGTNEMLRKTRGGQASQSQHITGKAVDVHFPDVPIRRMRYSAMIRERGGVGYYPTSALPFVHVDTARVRHWPRMVHDELALLFPRGHSKHMSAEGRSVEPGDAARARARQPQLAQQVAQFFDIRSQPRPAILVASADAVLPAAPAPKPAVRPNRPWVNPDEQAQVVAALVPPPPVAKPAPPEPAPRLVRAPQLVERSSQFTTGPSQADRAKLDELVTLAAYAPEPASPKLVAPPKPAERPAALAPAPQASPPPTAPVTNPGPAPDLPDAAVAALDRAAGGTGGSFIAAPAWDDDHPEELAYQPFPILPLMTETSSADDPALARMVHPDVARTFDMIDDEGRILPMKMRPGAQTAQLLFAQQFTGEAVDLAAIEAHVPRGRGVPTGLAERTVKTDRR